MATKKSQLQPIKTLSTPADRRNWLRKAAGWPVKETK